MASRSNSKTNIKVTSTLLSLLSLLYGINEHFIHYKCGSSALGSFCQTCIVKLHIPVVSETSSGTDWQLCPSDAALWKGSLFCVVIYFLYLLSISAEINKVAKDNRVHTRKIDRLALGCDRNIPCKPAPVLVCSDSW